MNTNKLLQTIRSGWSPIVVIAVTTFGIIAISIYCLASGYFIIFQNLFYIPIIIACVYYIKRGFAFSVIIACLYFFLTLGFTRDQSILLQALVRVLIFVLVAGVITYLSLARKRVEEELRQQSENLEKLVEERTAELEIANKTLQGEVTERYRLGKALQTETMNFDAVFESSPVAMLVIDETTNIVMVNLAGISMCGGDKAEILQHRPGNALRCVHRSKDTRGCGYSKVCKLCKVRNGVEGLIAKGGSMHGAELELELERNGAPSKVWMSIGVEPLLLDGREHWCIALEDITVRKQAENDLREDEALLSTAFNNSPVLMTISDLTTGKYLEVNNSFCRVSEYSREEAVGTTSIELGWISEEERTRLVVELQKQGQITDLELTLRSKSGQAVICRYSGEIIETAQGNKLFSTAEDITERKEAEKALRQKMEELHASNNELEQFNRASVGRELRMIELKEEINELCRRLGEAPRHATDQRQTDGVPGAAGRGGYR